MLIGEYQNANRKQIHELTLDDGVATVDVPMGRVQHVCISQKGETAVAEGFAWSAASTGFITTVTIASSNITSTATVSVKIEGL